MLVSLPFEAFEENEGNHLISACVTLFRSFSIRNCLVMVDFSNSDSVFSKRLSSFFGLLFMRNIIPVNRMSVANIRMMVIRLFH